MFFPSPNFDIFIVDKWTLLKKKKREKYLIKQEEQKDYGKNLYSMISQQKNY